MESLNTVAIASNAMTGIIYHIFCTKNGKCYVGQTWQSLEERVGDHKKPSSNCVKLRRAIKKYGRGSFVESVLTSGLTTQEDMNAAEVYWIGYFDSRKNGYNIKEGGGNGKHSEETKLKDSETNKKLAQQPWRKEQLKRAYLAMHTPEALVKQAESLREYAKTPEGKRKRRESLDKARSFAQTREAKLARIEAHGCKPFVCVNTGKRYEMCSEAAADLGLDVSSISKVLKGKRLKSTGGYKFRYET